MLALSILVLASCGGDDDNSNNNKIDASIKIIDAPKPIDAAIDAAPDAPPPTPMNILTACMHACDAISVCVMEPFGQECYDECAEDLADCSDAQVATIDACSTELCGDIKAEMSPLITCIMNVACVDMAVAFPRK
jgi:hypothetical protein